MLLPHHACTHNPRNVLLPHHACTHKPRNRPLPGVLGKHWVYDGISPFITQAIRVTGTNMKFPLVGRGDENPLKKVRLEGEGVSKGGARSD